MELHTNSSNNTIFADADGNIAYFHANFIPKRDPKFDWTQPGGRQRSGDRVEGRALGRREPERAQSRERLALQHEQLAVVGGGRGQPEAGGLSRRTWTRRRERRAASTRSACSRTRRTSRSTRCCAAAYDSYLPAFDAARSRALVQGVRRSAGGRSAQGASSPSRSTLLRDWDYAGRRRRCRRRSRSSGATSCGARVRRRGARRRTSADDYIASAAHAASSCCRRSSAASDKLAADFGTWKTPWGEINRFQRLTGDIVQPFDDAAPSIPVGVHVGALGLAGVVRRARRTRARRSVRHERQQLRRGGRVRRQRARARRSRPAARAAIRRRRTSTIRRSATARAICASVLLPRRRQLT